ncbi:MAG: type II toxin-antitoxin system VapC family toxin [Thermoanaerobaculia bacterium]
MKRLLDTNAYSALGRGHPSAAELVRQATEVLFSTVVLGEVLAGFRHGTRYQDNLDRLRRFLAEPRVRLVPVTWTTADRYSRLFAALRRKGRPIPTNDMWIAAHALETGADLVSFDPHFGHVEGLAWVKPDV